MLQSSVDVEAVFSRRAELPNVERFRLDNLLKVVESIEKIKNLADALQENAMHMRDAAQATASVLSDLQRALHVLGMQEFLAVGVSPNSPEALPPYRQQPPVTVSHLRPRLEGARRVPPPCPPHQRGPSTESLKRAWPGTGTQDDGKGSRRRLGNEWEASVIV